MPLITVLSLKHKNVLSIWCYSVFNLGKGSSVSHCTWNYGFFNPPCFFIFKRSIEWSQMIQLYSKRSINTKMFKVCLIFHSLWKHKFDKIYIIIISHRNDHVNNVCLFFFCICIMKFNFCLYLKVKSCVSIKKYRHSVKTCYHMLTYVETHTTKIMKPHMTELYMKNLHRVTQYKPMLINVLITINLEIVKSRENNNYII